MTADPTRQSDLAHGARGKRRLADTLANLESDIADLEAAKAAARTRAERKPINRQIHLLRGIVSTLSGLAGTQ